jgi:hypothetical protein
MAGPGPAGEKRAVGRLGTTALRTAALSTVALSSRRLGTEQWAGHRLIGGQVGSWGLWEAPQ